jgi:hypothetical protein
MKYEKKIEKSQELMFTIIIKFIKVETDTSHMTFKNIE